MKPKYAILLFAFITSVITGVLLSPASTYAASVYDGIVQSTSTLSLISPDGTQNVSVAEDGDLPWYELIRSKAQGYADVRCGDTEIGYLNTALDEGRVAVMQVVWGTEQRIFFAYSQDDYTSSQWEFRTASGVPYTELWSYGGPIHGGSMQIYNNGSYYWGCDNYASTDTFFGTDGSDTYFYRNNFNVVYPDGYGGVNFDDFSPSFGDVTRPQIGYAVDESYLLRAQYLRNLDNAGVIDTIHNTNYEWKYTVYESSFDYVKGDQIDTKTLDGLTPYEYQLPSAGYYVFTVDLSITPPAAPRTDIKGVTFNINADGTFKVASNVNLTCDDNGVCDDAASNCDYYSDIFQKTVCIVQKQLSVGVINPSINSFKAIVSSVIVSDSPSCSIPLPDVSISGRTLPFSELGPSACAQAANFRAVFPVAVVLINFVFAFLILLSVVGIVNRITDNNRHNLVEGI